MTFPRSYLIVLLLSITLQNSLATPIPIEFANHNRNDSFSTIPISQPYNSTEIFRASSQSHVMPVGLAAHAQHIPSRRMAMASLPSARVGVVNVKPSINETAGGQEDLEGETEFEHLTEDCRWVLVDNEALEQAYETGTAEESGEEQPVDTVKPQVKQFARGQHKRMILRYRTLGTLEAGDEIAKEGGVEEDEPVEFKTKVWVCRKKPEESTDAEKDSGAISGEELGVENMKGNTEGQVDTAPADDEEAEDDTAVIEEDATGTEPALANELPAGEQTTQADLPIAEGPTTPVTPVSDPVTAQTVPASPGPVVAQDAQPISDPASVNGPTDSNSAPWSSVPAIQPTVSAPPAWTPLPASQTIASAVPVWSPTPVVEPKAAAVPAWSPAPVVQPLVSAAPVWSPTPAVAAVPAWSSAVAVQPVGVVAASAPIAPGSWSAAPTPALPSQTQASPVWAPASTPVETVAGVNAYVGAGGSMPLPMKRLVRRYRQL